MGNIQHNRWVLFWRGLPLKGDPGACPLGNFEILDSRIRIFLHFEFHFLFPLLFLEVNLFEQIWTEHLLNSIPERCTIYQRKKKRNMISKFNHRKLALSMSSAKVGENHYRLISLILMLEQNILITITSWQPLVFIASPSFLSISAHVLHIFSRRFETLFITCRFNWALLHLLRFKRQDTCQNVFSLTFAFVSFLPKCLERIRCWKPFVCSYKQVLGSLQVGRPTRYPAIIETPDDYHDQANSLRCFKKTLG